MLQRLHIRNYAIIDDLTIEFQQGLNIITGETGAGKSILMGALGLVLGNRADTSVLLEPGEKCFVEATFFTKPRPAIAEALEALELAEEVETTTNGHTTLLLRREIAASGKSRSFINDTPVTLQGLRQVASLLVDLHRQFDTLQLGDDRFQFEVVDALAGNGTLLKQYATAYSTYKKAEENLKQLIAKQADAAKELDYTRFLYQELETLDLQPQELELLETEEKMLTHAETIKAALEQTIFALDEQETPLVQQLKQLANQVGSVSGELPELESLQERLLSTQIELQDITQELIRANDKVQLDPERLSIVTDRLSAGYKLLKKHQVTDTAALLALQDTLAETLAGIENMDERVVQATKEVKLQYEAALVLAKKISVARQKVVAPLEKQTAKYLSQMGMPNARLQVACTLQQSTGGVQQMDNRGIDSLQLLFDANKTGRFEPIEKVASGGELSRLMLAIKAQVAMEVQLPALIFDEIDTGISGEAARQVGLLMQQLSAGHQVIAITHQPQIAAKAAAHYFVYKQAKGNSIKTKLRLLEPAERVEAIARMLSGEQLTEASVKIAQEMMNQAV